MSYPWEQLGRAKKVQALVLTLDAMLRTIAIDTHSADAERAIGNLSPEGWTAAAQVAGVKAPSLQTQVEVIALYRRRAAKARSVPA